MLETEISEVQDTFRDKDAKEFKRVKWELEKLSKSCRNLQIKLGKTQAKAVRLRSVHLNYWISMSGSNSTRSALYRCQSYITSVLLASILVLREHKRFMNLFSF